MPQAAASRTDCGHIRLSEILSSAAREIDGLAGMTATLESAIGSDARLAAMLGPDQMRALQQLDLLRQSLVQLATFFETLPRAINQDPPVDAARAAASLALAHLAEALVGQPPLTPAANDHDAAGELDLFT